MWISSWKLALAASAAVTGASAWGGTASRCPAAVAPAFAWRRAPCTATVAPRGILRVQARRVLGAASFTCAPGNTVAQVEFTLEYRTAQGGEWRITRDQAPATLRAGVYEVDGPCFAGVWSVTIAYRTSPSPGPTAVIKYLEITGPVLTVTNAECARG